MQLFYTRRNRIALVKPAYSHLGIVGFPHDEKAVYQAEAVDTELVSGKRCLHIVCFETSHGCALAHSLRVIRPAACERFSIEVSRWPGQDYSLDLLLCYSWASSVLFS